MNGFVDCEQGTDEWRKARIGSIGGSTISDVVACGEGKTRRKLMCDLVEEMFTGIKKEIWLPYRVKELASYEDEARDFYMITTGRPVNQIGLYKDGPHKHVSPDGLIDNSTAIRGNTKRLLEIKCVEITTFEEFKRTRKIVTGYRKQIQWGMGLLSLQVSDYLVYCPFIEPFEKRGIILPIERDNKEIAELQYGADKFIKEMLKLKSFLES